MSTQAGAAISGGGISGGAATAWPQANTMNMILNRQDAKVAKKCIFF
jgi:hypothetical protein